MHSSGTSTDSESFRQPGMRISTPWMRQAIYDLSCVRKACSWNLRQYRQFQAPIINRDPLIRQVVTSIRETFIDSPSQLRRPVDHFLPHDA